MQGAMSKDNKRITLLDATLDKPTIKLVTRLENTLVVTAVCSEQTRSRLTFLETAGCWARKGKFCYGYSGY